MLLPWKVETDRIARVREPVAVTLIVLVNFFIFLFPHLCGVYTFEKVVALWSISPQEVTGFCYKAFLSSFVHHHFIHLAANMFFLWVFGTALEDRVGFTPFTLIYFMGAITAVYAVTLVDPTCSLRIMGASGAVSAVIGALVVFGGLSPVYTLFVTPFFVLSLRIPVFLFAFLWLGLQMLFAGGTVDLSVAGHAGGFVAGAVTALIMVAVERMKKLSIFLILLFTLASTAPVFAVSSSPLGKLKLFSGGTEETDFYKQAVFELRKLYRKYSVGEGERGFVIPRVVVSKKVGKAKVSLIFTKITSMQDLCSLRDCRKELAELERSLDGVVLPSNSAAARFYLELARTHALARDYAGALALAEASLRWVKSEEAFDLAEVYARGCGSKRKVIRIKLERIMWYISRRLYPRAIREMISLLKNSRQDPDVWDGVGAALIRMGEERLGMSFRRHAEFLRMKHHQQDKNKKVERREKYEGP